MACAGGADRDRDGDGSTEAEDCDDRDPAVYPGAPDVAGDQLDHDCDGYDTASDTLGEVDRLVSVDPPRHLQLGHDLDVADLTGDGAAEVLAGSQQASVDDAEAGQAWLFDGATRQPLAHWQGASLGFQLLGQDVEVALGPQPQLLLRSLEGVWVLDADASSGYPGDVGGSLISGDADGYLVGNRIKSIPLVGDAQADVVVECGRDVDGTPEAVCVTTGPVHADAKVGDSDIIIDGDHLGSAFAGPDVDGDGSPDLVVGADGAHDEAGAVYLAPGPLESGHFDPSVFVQEWTGENSGDWLGAKLFTSDLDGDGLQEILADAMAWPGQERRGRLYALDTTVGDVRDSPLIVDGDPGLQHLGMAAAAADLDGDGIVDLAVGAPGLATLDPEVRGRVLVFYGPVAGHLGSEDAGRIFSGTEPGDQTGGAIRAGDVDGDGAVDLVVGASYADGARLDSGRIYILEGPITRW